MTAMIQTLELADKSTREDLRNFLQRLARLGEGEVRMQSRGSALAVYGCTQTADGLLDNTTVVLGMRAFRLASAQDPALDVAPIDVTVEVRALSDRLARMSGPDVVLAIPDVTVSAAWAGVLPPVSGWEPRGKIDAASLATVAAEGMSRVAAAVPTDAGDPLVKKVRRDVWGTEIAPGIPASAAFAAEGLGFLSGADHLTMASTRSWTRLSGPNGHVLLRRSMSI